MAGRVEGKLALVTGGAQGLGAATGRRLVEEGARIVLSDLNEQGAQDTAAAICAEHGEDKAYAIGHDVADPDDWDRVIDFVKDKLGGLSVLVNNAGIGIRGDIETCTLEDWRRGFAVNVGLTAVKVRFLVSDAPLLGGQHPFFFCKILSKLFFKRLGFLFRNVEHVFCFLARVEKHLLYLEFHRTLLPQGHEPAEEVSYGNSHQARKCEKDQY